MEENYSEFGRGLVICLVKFAEHFYSFYSNKDYKLIGEEMGESEQVSLWANGATDHLYEIKVPEGKDWDEIREKVTCLRNEGLRIRHSFNNERYCKEDVDSLMRLTKEKGLRIRHSFNNETYCKEDVDSLMRLTKEICILVDKKLGIEDAAVGEW